MSEMYWFLIATLLCCSEVASISLSPLGMVTVCPEGQLLLICERVTGSMLHWNVSIPHPAGATSQRIIVPASPRVVLSPDFKIGVTEFNITRTSDSPLTSQLLINNVTTEINESTIYCSEDGNENNAKMTAINVKYKDEFLGSMDHSLNVTMVNQLLRSDDVTVTLQWPREPGAVYHISVSPEVSYTEHASMGHYIFAINLTISYNVQYNVSIVSSPCGITTSRILKYVTCNYPPIQSLHDPVAVVSGSQDSPPIEGQFITYTCPPGFILTGPNMLICMGNREWEPDPGTVDCIADLDCGLPPVGKNITLDYMYSSTLESLYLILTCENEMFNMNLTESDGEILNVTCHSNGSWIPDPADFIQSCLPSTVTTLQGLNNETSEDSLLLIILIPSIILLFISLILFILTPYIIVRIRVAKKTLDEEHSNEDPTYDDIVPCHQDNAITLEENDAYGHVKRITKI